MVGCAAYSCKSHSSSKEPGITYHSKCIENGEGWTLTMKVNVMVSESCRSFGDCLRDLDAKGVLRGEFVLLEPGTVSNVDLLPLLKKHNITTKSDKGCAMTLILQESAIRGIGRCPHEELLVATDSHSKLLFYKKLGSSKDNKLEFPLEIFLDNASVSLHHNLNDTHMAICSSSVLPLFSDNFDFQTKDDFVRGLLMNEEILGSTVYCHILKGNQFAGSITNWRMYQALSYELRNNWVHPLIPSTKRNRKLKNDVFIGEGTKISETAELNDAVLGDDVALGKNVRIEDSFVFSNTKIGDNVVITHSIIGEHCTIQSGSEITSGSILENGCVLEKDTFVKNSLLVAKIPDNYENGDKLADKAYRLRIFPDEDDNISINELDRKLSRLDIGDFNYESDEIEDAFSDSGDEQLSYTQTPPPDDTKLFYTEVIDSLTRGLEDKLPCDNLILEINSSRYAYNVILKEVNFNIVKAVLILSLRQPETTQYFGNLSRVLTYFAPVLKNYIRNESAMKDCLEAIQDVAVSSESLHEKCVTFILQYFYHKDYISEDAILNWFSTLTTSSKLYKQVKPFTDWLKEAEEESGEEESEQ
ncbi:unnamed protein product [Callosobruchus maculatus]|uniref:Translation initiation factor eIF2B subunit epsilon n=1 Tax=Callosobruchus maculatus TaxID=64391 RepID=A0A653CHF4_CALMS|nr:unnamed protein product [Callosobruchus maculatus]